MDGIKKSQVEYVNALKGEGALVSKRTEAALAEREKLHREHAARLKKIAEEQQRNLDKNREDQTDKEGEEARSAAAAAAAAEQEKADEIAKQLKELKENRKIAALEYAKVSTDAARKAAEADLESIRERKQAAQDLAQTRVQALIDERRQQKQINKDMAEEDNKARGLMTKQRKGVKLSRKDREFLDAWKTIQQAGRDADNLGRAEQAKEREIERYGEQLKRLDTIAERLKEIKEQNRELLIMR